MSANDNETDDELEVIIEEVHIIGEAALMGTLVERKLTQEWLRKTAAEFLFAADLDPELQEYGTTVLEMVADALDEREHWRSANLAQETLQ